MKWKLSSLSKIRNKVLLFGLLMSTVPLIVISLYYSSHVKEDLQNKRKEAQTTKSESIASEIQLELKESIDQLRLLSKVPHVEEHPELYEELLGCRKAAQEVVRFDSGGEVKQRISRLPLVDRRNQPWADKNLLQKLKQGEKKVACGRVEQNQAGKGVIKCAVPLYTEEQKVRGGLGVVLDVDKMVKPITSRQLIGGEIVSLVDHNKGTLSQYGATGVRDSDRFREAEAMVGVKSKVPLLGWTLVLEQPEKEAFSSVYRMMEKGTLAVFIVGFLVSLISIYAGLYFTQPIVKLQSAMRRLKAGEWPEQIRLKRSDEFGELAQAFNEMNRELKIKSQRLSQEKERLHVIVNGIGTGLAIVREDFRITWMNPLLKNWLEESGDKSPACYELFKDRKTPCPNCSGWDIKEGSGVGQVMTKILPNGDKRIFRHRLYPLKHTRDGKNEGLIMMEDITEQRKVEEKLIQTDKLSALGLMASNFAHEVNNPLASIAVYAEDLTDRLDEEGEELFHTGEVAQYLRVIQSNTERCKQITDHLLNFSRKSDWREGDLDVESVIRDSVAMLHYGFSKKKVELNVEVEPDLPEVSGDAFKLMQVVVNLVNNAADAMEEKGGRLTLSAKRRSGKILIRVEDTGEGIPEEHLPKLFDPFFTTKPAGRGTGLGLSVCYGIVQQFGGTLHVESRVGTGTAVEVTLPVQKWRDFNEQNSHSGG